MELWIRSQDKERLTIVRDLRLYYAKSDDLWVIEDCDDIGYYKTKERALEVLDEIHHTLINICDSMNRYHVYEMPKE